MTQDEADELVANYEKLCRRASLMFSFENGEYIKVWFQDGKAYAQSARNERGYYGDYHMEPERYECDPAPFLLDDESFEAWHSARTVAQKRHYEQEQAARQAAYQMERERQERALFETLKQKYGNKFGIF